MIAKQSNNLSVGFSSQNLSQISAPPPVGKKEAKATGAVSPAPPQHCQVDILVVEFVLSDDKFDVYNSSELCQCVEKCLKYNLGEAIRRTSEIPRLPKKQQTQSHAVEKVFSHCCFQLLVSYWWMAHFSRMHDSAIETLSNFQISSSWHPDLPLHDVFFPSGGSHRIWEELTSPLMYPYWNLNQWCVGPGWDFLSAMDDGSYFLLLSLCGCTCLKSPPPPSP